jgi:hypothetical protein
MRCVLWFIAASIGCAGSRSSAPQTVLIEDEPAATNGEEAYRDEDETESDGDAAAGLDFSEDVAAPSAAVSAPPDRRPSGAFELCGDKCRDNTELKKSLEDFDDE